MTKKILHVCYIDKFIPSFVRLVRSEVKSNIHTFTTMGSNYDKYPIEDADDLTYYSGRFLRYLGISQKMNVNDKIMLHGLFDPGIILVLFCQPWLLKKCYWVMWGGDIYAERGAGFLSILLDKIKCQVVKRIGFLVTYIEGDFLHVKEKYKAKGVLKYCIMYPSNCYKKIEDKKDNNTGVLNVQVGNSADETNEHQYIYSRLKSMPTGKYKVFSPLSYGPKMYAEKMEYKGREFFGDKFIPMYDFMKLEDYTIWQSSLDIAIFAHKRQQGMGNIITLLGLGISVYMRPNLSSTLALEKLGLKLGNIEEGCIKLLPQSDLIRNIAIVKREFSKKTLVRQLTEVFDD